MAKVSVTVCDVCGTQEAVEQYEVRKEDQRVKLDFCKEHSRPLEEILSNGVSTGLPGRKPAAKKTASTRGRRGSGTVSSMEEIEASKASTK